MAIRSWKRRWQGLTETLTPNLWRNTVRSNWHLGLTAFGGPPVHFKIVRCLLAKRSWDNELLIPSSLGSTTTSSS